MNQYIYASYMFFCILQSCFAQQVAAQHTILKYFLEEAGNKSDVHFTVEGAYPSNMFSDVLISEYISSTHSSGDIESVLSALTNSITNLTVMTDVSNKMIYHLIDKRLTGLDNYAMNVVLTNIIFKGDADTFVDHLQETISNISNPTMYGGDLIILNGGTSISIDDRNVTVREALSKGVNLARDQETYVDELHFARNTSDGNPILGEKPTLSSEGSNLEGGIGP